MRDARSALCVRSFVRRDTSEDVCALCGLKSGEDADVEGFMAGPLLAFEQGSRIVWVHDGCAAASSEVRVLDDAWFHVHAAISRGRRIQCAACGQKGATLGCISSECPHSYHGRCAALHQKWDLRLHRPLGYPKRSKHACIESDSSDDEVDERFPAFSCLACRPPLPKLKPYAQHCTAPSSMGGLRSNGTCLRKRCSGRSALLENRRPSRRRRHRRPRRLLPYPSARRGTHCCKGKAAGARGPAAAPWRPQPPPPPPPDWVHEAAVIFVVCFIARSVLQESNASTRSLPRRRLPSSKRRSRICKADQPHLQAGAAPRTRRAIPSASSTSSRPRGDRRVWRWCQVERQCKTNAST